MTNKSRHCIIVHYDEIAVKLGNRPWFERQLVKNIKNQLKGLNYSTIQKFSARIFVNDIDLKQSNLYLETLQNVMGVSSVHSMINIVSDTDVIKKNALELLKSVQDEFQTFKIFTKRQNKAFPQTSPELNALVGDVIRVDLEKKVNLKNPDIELRLLYIISIVFSV